MESNSSNSIVIDNKTYSLDKLLKLSSERKPREISTASLRYAYTLFMSNSKERLPNANMNNVVVALLEGKCYQQLLYRFIAGEQHYAKDLFFGKEYSNVLVLSEEDLESCLIDDSKEERDYLRSLNAKKLDILVNQAEHNKSNNELVAINGKTYRLELIKYLAAHCVIYPVKSMTCIVDKMIEDFFGEQAKEFLSSSSYPSEDSATNKENSPVIVYTDEKNKQRPDLLIDGYTSVFEAYRYNKERINVLYINDEFLEICLGYEKRFL